VRKWRYNRSPAWPASARSIRTAIQAHSPFAAERSAVVCEREPQTLIGNWNE
jgi:hypothetical protein